MPTGKYKHTTHNIARIAAKEKGLLIFNGRQCKSCHSRERYISNYSCVKCNKKQSTKIDQIMLIK